MNRHQKILITISVVVSCFSIIFSVFNATKNKISFTQTTYQGTVEKWENGILTIKDNTALYAIYVIPETQFFIDIYSNSTKKTLQKSNPITIQNITAQNLVGKKASVLAVRSKKGTIIASEVRIQVVAQAPGQDGDTNVDILFPPPRIPTIPKP